MGGCIFGAPSEGRVLVVDSVYIFWTCEIQLESWFVRRVSPCMQLTTGNQLHKKKHLLKVVILTGNTT